jgi:hypothetical protein
VAWARSWVRPKSGWIERAGLQLSAAVIGHRRGTSRSALRGMVSVADGGGWVFTSTLK